MPIWTHELARTDFAALTPIAWAYVLFNALEALAWLGLAGWVLVRALRHRRGPLEWAYAGSFLLFAMTDVAEIRAMPVWLLITKGVVLALILGLRRRVLRNYPGSRI